MNENDPMPPTTLSPAAQAVQDAYFNRLGGFGYRRDYRNGLAAALRAVADQLVPKTPTLSYPEDYELGVWVANDDTRTEILDIATELEGSL